MALEIATLESMAATERGGSLLCAEQLNATAKRGQKVDADSERGSERGVIRFASSRFHFPRRPSKCLKWEGASENKAENRLEGGGGLFRLRSPGANSRLTTIRHTDAARVAFGRRPRGARVGTGAVSVAMQGRHGSGAQITHYYAWHKS